VNDFTLCTPLITYVFNTAKSTVMGVSTKIFKKEGSGKTKTEKIVS